MVVRALGVLEGSEAEVESQLNKANDVAGFGVGDGGSRCHDRLNDAKEGGLLMLDVGILDPVSFELKVEAPVRACDSLEFGGVVRLERISRTWVTAIDPHA